MDRYTLYFRAFADLVRRRGDLPGLRVLLVTRGTGLRLLTVVLLALTLAYALRPLQWAARPQWPITLSQPSPYGG